MFKNCGLWKVQEKCQKPQVSYNVLLSNIGICCYGIYDINIFINMIEFKIYNEAWKAKDLYSYIPIQDKCFKQWLLFKQ